MFGRRCSMTRELFGLFIRILVDVGLAAEVDDVEGWVEDEATDCVETPAVVVWNPCWLNDFLDKRTTGDNGISVRDCADDIDN